MDAAITNSSSAAIYIPGPEIEIAAGATETWSGITLADLDANEVIKAGVVAGNLSVSMTPDSDDASQAAQGSLNPAGKELYAYASLPTGYEGRTAFCTNGRKDGEGAAAGTGVPVYFSNGSWRRYYDDAAVTI